MLFGGARVRDWSMRNSNKEVISEELEHEIERDGVLIYEEAR